MPETLPGNLRQSFMVTKFDFKNNTAFSTKELESKFTNNLINRNLSLSELLEVAAKISNLYKEKGYTTSGAIISIPEETENKGKGTIIIDVIEDEIQEIRVIPYKPPQNNLDRGKTNSNIQPKPLRINPEYIRSRLSLATSKPLKISRLEEALQLLRLNSPLDKVSATLSAGSAPGKTILEVQVQEANNFNIPLSFNNSRSPSAGSFQRRLGINDTNFLGEGDTLNGNFANTDGSNSWDLSYTIPFNARNGTINFSYSNSTSTVIEPPFNILNINSKSRTYEFTLRQPIMQRIKEQTYQELSLGLTFSRRESETFLLGEAYPLAQGADKQGRTRISALRFFQEWTQQNSQGVIALRSQFNLGVDAFGVTINKSISEVNEVVPDNRFFYWQGQAQLARLLAPKTLLLLRSNVQVGDAFGGRSHRSLVPLEQFAIGGLGSVRGYRQDALLADNGVFASAEIQLPILRVPQWQTLLQLTPFIDYGTAWNSSGKKNPQPSSLSSIGLGLQLRQGNSLTARLDWGIPLINIESRDRTWQENGLYFSLLWNPF